MLTTQELMYKIKSNKTNKNILLIAWLLMTGLMFFKKSMSMTDEIFFMLAFGSISTLILTLSINSVQRIEELTLELREGNEDEKNGF